MDGRLAIRADVELETLQRCVRYEADRGVSRLVAFANALSRTSRYSAADAAIGGIFGAHPLSLGFGYYGRIVHQSRFGLSTNGVTTRTRPEAPRDCTREFAKYSSQTPDFLSDLNTLTLQILSIDQLGIARSRVVA